MKVSILSSAARLACGLAAAFLLFAGTVQTHAYPGDPDTSFTRIGGINGAIFAVVVDPWTNIWIAGDFTSVAGHPANYLAVLNPDGTFKTAPVWDLNFGGPFRVHALTIGTGASQTWGVYAAGQRGVARFRWDDLNGVYPQDRSFENPYVNGAGRVSQLNTITIRDTDDTTFVGGQFGIFRLDLTGRTNTMILQPELQNQYFTHIRFVPATTYFPNLFTLEHLLVCGGFGATEISPTGTSMESIYYANAGRAYPTVAAERYPGNYYTCSPGHGEFLVGGSLDAGPTYTFGSSSGASGSGLILGRFGFGSDSGTYFPAISSSTNSPADQGNGLSVIEALDGGDMLVGGYISRIRGVNVDNFAHLLADGTVDASFRNTVGMVPMAMAMQPDGKYVIVGHNEFTPVTGQIVRRNPMDPPRPIIFTSQPTNRTVYAGDPVSMSAAYDAWPPSILAWTKNGSELIDSRQATLSFYPATVTDTGDYRLRAKGFCTGNHDSEAGHLTVLAAPAAPANDMFANAFVLTGMNATGTGTIRSATLQPGEPDPSNISGGASVWWTWTAPSNGLVTIGVSGSDYRAPVNVFTGNALNSLTFVTNNCRIRCDEGCYCAGLQTNLSFVAAQGMTYRIAVGGQPPVGGLGNIVLTLGETFIVIVPNPWLQTQFGASEFDSAAFGAGKYLVGGRSGKIAASTNGSNWGDVNAPFDSSGTVWGMDYVNGKFVAVGDFGTIITSPDGTSWTVQASGVDPGYSFYSVAHGTNNFSVAVGGGGTIATSSDQIHWTPRVSGFDATAEIYSVAYGNGLYVAVGGSGISTSSDGTNWVVHDTGDYFNSVTWGKGRFVALGTGIHYSADGITWTSATTPINKALFWIAYGAGYFVAVGQSGTILTSPDGDHWTTDNSGTSQSLWGTAYAQTGQFLAVGDAGTILLHRPLQILSPTLITGGNIQFQVGGINGATVVLDCTTSLQPPNWQPVATNTFVNGLVTFNEPTTSPPTKFYRARLQ